MSSSSSKNTGNSHTFSNPNVGSIYAELERFTKVCFSNKDAILLAEQFGDGEGEKAQSWLSLAARCGEAQRSLVETDSNAPEKSKSGKRRPDKLSVATSLSRNPRARESCEAYHRITESILGILAEHDKLVGDSSICPDIDTQQDTTTSTTEPLRSLAFTFQLNMKELLEMRTFAPPVQPSAASYGKQAFFPPTMQ